MLEPKALMAAIRAAALGLVLMAAPAAAQAPIPVEVDRITTTQSCEYFRNYAGSRATMSEAEYARRWGWAAARRYYASYSTWYSWIVRDCQDNFQTLRNSVEAALASTGRLTSGPGGYTLDVTISDMSETAPAQNRPVSGENAFHTSWGTAVVTMSYTLRDEAGRAVDGGVLTKRVEMSRAFDSNRMRVRTGEPAGAAYDLIQQEVALAIARKVTFLIDPLRVSRVEGRDIEVNYGQPLLELGTILLVDKDRGIGTVRYRVISAAANRAVAEVDGDNDTSDIQPGALATLVEADSDAANGRRYRRVPLP